MNHEIVRERAMGPERKREREEEGRKEEIKARRRGWGENQERRSESKEEAWV